MDLAEFPHIEGRRWAFPRGWTDYGTTAEHRRIDFFACSREFRALFGQEKLVTESPCRDHKPVEIEVIGKAGPHGYTAIWEPKQGAATPHGGFKRQEVEKALGKLRKELNRNWEAVKMTPLGNLSGSCYQVTVLTLINRQPAS